ncbi:MAG TPA: hypothetical protein VKU91_03060, partial [Acidimicrobiales bacterium]|nr:hypothetical protein [Acidimicrobiales bacterium]
SQVQLGELAHALSVLTGAPSAPGPAGGHQFRQGDVVADLTVNRYIDDGALRLSRYRYVLSARFNGQHPLADTPEVAFVRYAAELVRQRVGAGALLVLDLEQRDPAYPVAAALDGEEA